MAPSLGEAGEFVQKICALFDFHDVAEKLPSKTFSGEMQVQAGDKQLHRIEVGPVLPLMELDFPAPSLRE